MNITIPISWLREFLKTDANAKTIAELLSLHGPSVERIEKRSDDYIFDVEVTSNRPDAFSVFGLAREANAILNFNGFKSSLIDPKGINTSLMPDVKKKLSLEVVIQNPNLCPRFMAVIIDNIKVKPSPALIKNRLEASGVRSINNIVDITNYIMLELGQPMHAFDFDKIKGAKMYLRESTKGESIKTLDGQNRKLPSASIVITDAERLIDLCGIMGGANSGISTRTKRVLLFVQAYDPIKIRQTTQALAFRTEAAARFEKGVDIEKTQESLAEAVYLAKKTAGAKIASELIDIYKKPNPPAGGQKTITLTKNLLEDYLAIEFSMEKAASILKLLGFAVKDQTNHLTAQPPSWRHEDMEAAEDLIEEIARVYGYHNLPSTLTTGSLPIQNTPSDLSQVINLKNALKYLGLTEVISYSIISEEFLKLTGVKKENAVELSNPLSSEWQFMRPTILVSLASIISQNQNLKNNLKIFEVAKTYLPNNQTSQLPTQDLHLSIALQNSDFYQIKGIVENVFEILGREVEFRKIEQGSSLTKERLNLEESLLEKPISAQIVCNSKPVGFLGLLNRKVANHFTLEGNCAVAELNLTTSYRIPATKYSYRPIPKFPPVIEDISAIFENDTPVAEIVKTVKSAGSPLLKQVEILDIYSDEKIGKNKKSVTLHLTYQKPNSTPTQEEVNLVRKKIIFALEKTIAAQIRR